MKIRLALAAVLAVFLVSCDNPQRNIDSLRRDIAAFRATPTDAAQAQIEADLSKLESQIAALNNPEKQQLFRLQVKDLRGDFQAAKIARTVNDAKNAILGVGEAFKDGARTIQEAFQGTNSSD